MGCREVQSQGAPFLTEGMDGYAVRVRRSQRRRLVIITGALCLVVGIGLTTVWEEAVLRYHLRRLRTEPEYLLEVVIDRIAREERERAVSWLTPLQSDANYLVEFVEYDRHPKSSLAWAAVRKLMETGEGRQACVWALQRTGFEAALEKLRER